jgi:hypothetical protein
MCMLPDHVRFLCSSHCLVIVTCVHRWQLLYHRKVTVLWVKEGATYTRTKDRAEMTKEGFCKRKHFICAFIMLVIPETY